MTIITITAGGVSEKFVREFATLKTKPQLTALYPYLESDMIDALFEEVKEEFMVTEINVTDITDSEATVTGVFTGDEKVPDTALFEFSTTETFDYIVNSVVANIDLSLKILTGTTTVTGLMAETVYYVRVKSMLNGVDSYSSLIVNFETLVSPEFTPLTIVPTDITATSVTLAGTFEGDDPSTDPNFDRLQFYIYNNIGLAEPVISDSVITIDNVNKTLTGGAITPPLTASTQYWVCVYKHSADGQEDMKYTDAVATFTTTA